MEQKKKTKSQQKPKNKVLELDYKKVWEATLGKRGTLLTIVYQDEVPDEVRYENKNWKVISGMPWWHPRNGESFRYELDLIIKKPE